MRDRVTKLWEILVPARFASGNYKNAKIPVEYHKVWDSKVREISGGLTIMKPARGIWESEGEIYSEEMIPVRILCDVDSIMKIADMTKEYYDQKAVMYYKVSDEAMITYR